MARDIVSLALILATTMVLPAIAAAQDTAHREGTSALLETPSALKAEHEQLHADLSHATKLGGKTGEAAKHVAAVLHEHFVSEEELAWPPLALLVPIAEGHATSRMRSVVTLTDRLKAQMPRMLEEHQAIVHALDELGRAAAMEQHPEVTQFVTDLKAHAQNEEQVLYPAALLVGEYLKLKFPTGR